MEFLGIGFPELLMILLVALLVVGPQRLPAVAAQIARFIREFRTYSANMTRELTEALEELEREAATAKDELSAAKEEWHEVGQGLRSTTSEITESLHVAKREAETGTPASSPASTALPPADVGSDGHTASGRPDDNIP